MKYNDRFPDVVATRGEKKGVLWVKRTVNYRS
jgi:hypothetical protein